MWDNEVFKPKLFVNYRRKKFHLATSANKQVNTSISSNACGHKFKATDGWNTAKTITALQEESDESVIVQSTCNYGVKWRFLNIYGGGEWQSHSIRLIKAVLHEAPHFTNLKLCYDVPCLLESVL